jgi:hypothetical protein
MCLILAGFSMLSLLAICLVLSVEGSSATTPNLSFPVGQFRVNITASLPSWSQRGPSPDPSGDWSVIYTDERDSNKVVVVYAHLNDNEGIDVKITSEYKWVEVTSKTLTVMLKPGLIARVTERETRSHAPGNRDPMGVLPTTGSDGRMVFALNGHPLFPVDVTVEV